ncbi:hypothetical protein H0H87_004375, partial [Tephrocybe sp. NHM501043]
MTKAIICITEQVFIQVSMLRDDKVVTHKKEAIMDQDSRSKPVAASISKEVAAEVVRGITCDDISSKGCFVSHAKDKGKGNFGFIIWDGN